MWPNIGELILGVDFRFKEFFVSSKYPALAEARGRSFSNEDILKAHIITNTILQPTRDHFNQPQFIHLDKDNALIISSAFCSLALNNLIRPDNKDSDHTAKGMALAIDFVVQRVPCAEIFTWIKTNLPYAFGQLTYYPKPNLPDEHIHVSLPTHKHQYEAFVSK